MPTVKVAGKVRHLPYSAAGIAKAKMLRATPTMGKPATAGKPVTAGKPATAGSRTAPSSHASATAMARSHGQQGAAMKAAHASTPATNGNGKPATMPPTAKNGVKVGIPEKGKMAKGRRIAG